MAIPWLQISRSYDHGVEAAKIFWLVAMATIMIVRSYSQMIVMLCWMLLIYGFKSMIVTAVFVMLVIFQWCCSCWCCVDDGWWTTGQLAIRLDAIHRWLTRVGCSKWIHRTVTLRVQNWGYKRMGSSMLAGSRTFATVQGALARGADWKREPLQSKRQNNKKPQRCGLGFKTTHSSGASWKEWNMKGF